MFEKNMKLAYLLDFYGDILPERKRNVLDMYYNEDFSLAEISEEIGISRQGVRDIIKKAEEYGITKENLVFDPLCMTVSTNKDNAKITLECIEKLTNEFGKGFSSRNLRTMRKFYLMYPFGRQCLPN